MTLIKDVQSWIEGDVSALVLRENLIPVEGKEAPFFPPTFAGSSSEDVPYCIDVMKDGTRVCLIDTVGSQANRMEPIFMQAPYDKLIPQITINAGQDKINLCKVGHRAADAFLRNSSISGDIKKALVNMQEKNDALGLAKIAPTSLVFGMWDSRDTQVKTPRIVSSVIRAYDIDLLSRSAQYFPPVDYREDTMLGEYKNKREKDVRSELGYNEIPSTNTHGGIIAHGVIRRDVVVNFAALRKIRSADSDQTATLQKYILGLSLVAASSIKEWDLRQGCLLTRDPSSEESGWESVRPDGKRNTMNIEHDEVLKYAQKAADEFTVGTNRDDVRFIPNNAKKEIESKQKEKKE
ncbi:MAG: type I-U CRISPR-associated RAMP protein Csb1/Cas7u [Thaumarchaeota archaeon]|nr:type I-U CRISPR-associated RAMP protein Csb1/Cas7u [Nitrososphaerota archaeon]